MESNANNNFKNITGGKCTDGNIQYQIWLMVWIMEHFSIHQNWYTVLEGETNVITEWNVKDLSIPHWYWWHKKYRTS